jgi:hypothetical protein
MVVGGSFSNEKMVCDEVSIAAKSRGFGSLG